jgi:hypothetical protein
MRPIGTRDILQALQTEIATLADRASAQGERLGDPRIIDQARGRAAGLREAERLIGEALAQLEGSEPPAPPPCGDNHGGSHIRCTLPKGHAGPHRGYGYTWCCTSQSEAEVHGDRLRHRPGCPRALPAEGI